MWVLCVGIHPQAGDFQLSSAIWLRRTFCPYLDSLDVCLWVPPRSLLWEDGQGFSLGSCRRRPDGPQSGSVGQNGGGDLTVGKVARSETGQNGGGDLTVGRVARSATTKWESHPRHTNHGPRATNHGPRATNHGPRATGHEPRATSHEPRAYRSCWASSSAAVKRGSCSSNAGPVKSHMWPPLMVWAVNWAGGT